MNSQEDEPMEVDSPKAPALTKRKDSDGKRKMDSRDDDFEAKRQRLNHMAPPEFIPLPSAPTVAETSQVINPAPRRIKKAKRRHAQVQAIVAPTSDEMNTINVQNPTVPTVEDGHQMQKRVTKSEPVIEVPEISVHEHEIQESVQNPSIEAAEDANRPIPPDDIAPRSHIPLQETPKRQRRRHNLRSKVKPPTFSLPSTPVLQEPVRKYEPVFQASGLGNTRVIQEKVETSAAENDSNCAQVRNMAQAPQQHKRVRNDNINSYGNRQGNSTFASVNTAKRAREDNNNINPNGNRPEHNAKEFATSSSSSSNENYNQQRRKRQVLSLRHRRQQQYRSPLRSSASPSPERNN